MTVLVRPDIPQEKVQGFIDSGVAELQHRPTEEIGSVVGALGQKYFEEALQSERVAEYSKAYSGAVKDFTKLSEERYSKLYDSNGNPLYGSIPKDIEDISFKVKQSALAGVQDSKVAEQLTVSLDNYLSQQQVVSLSHSRQQQQQHVKGTSLKSIQDLSSAAEFAPQSMVPTYTNQIAQIAQSATAAGGFTLTEAVVLANKSNSQISKGRVRLESRTDPYAVLSKLESDPKYQNLKPDDYLQVLGETRGQVAKLEAQKKAAVAAANTQLNSLLKLADDTISSGGTIPTKNLDNIMGYAEAAGRKDEVQGQLQELNARQEFAYKSPIERRNALNEMSTTITPDNVAMYNKLQTSDTKLNTAITKDAFSFGVSQRLVPAPEPLDWTQDLSPQLQPRLAGASNIAAHTGMTSVAPMTSNEIDMVRDKLNVSDYRTAAKKLGELVNGLGNNSMAVFRELDKKGSSYYAYLGSMIQDGNTDVAAKILEGRDARKNVKGIINEEGFNGLLSKAFKDGDIPQYSSVKKQGVVNQYIKDTYAALLKENNEFGRTDKSLFKEAIKTVTNGNAFVYNGISVEPPARDIDSGEFTNWVRSVTDEAIVKTGGWIGFPNGTGTSSVLQHAQLHSVGRGKYLVYAKDTATNTYLPMKTIVRSNTGESHESYYVLDYNKINNARGQK